MLCHPSWDVRRVARETTRKISSASSILLEDLFLEFSSWLSVLGERIFLSKARSVLSGNLCCFKTYIWITVVA